MDTYRQIHSPSTSSSLESALLKAHADVSRLAQHNKRLREANDGLYSAALEMLNK